MGSPARFLTSHLCPQPTNFIFLLIRKRFLRRYYSVYWEHVRDCQAGGLAMNQLLLLILCVIMLVAEIFFFLWVAGIIHIKRFTPPEASTTFLVALILPLALPAQILFTIYPPAEPFTFGILVGMAILVVYWDKRRSGQTTRRDKEHRRPVQKDGAKTQIPFKKFDLVQVILGTLLFVALMGIAFFPIPGFHDKFIVFTLLVGLLIFYNGAKKIAEARAHQQGREWYKQPEILCGLGVLLGVLPFLMQEDVISNTVPALHVISSLVFGGVTLLLFFAATYFFFRGNRQGQQHSENMDKAIILKQTLRSGAQPKEARED